MKNLILILFITLIPNIFNAQSIKLDEKLGEENAKMVEVQMGIYDDVEKTNYIKEVGERLIAQLDNPLFDYQFALVPDPSPNAFAIPGGYLYVTTGLLAILESEDELACIMGHEIIHSNNRHAVKQLNRSIVPRLLEVPGNLLGVINKDLGDIFNAPIQTSNALLYASYGRLFETEADMEGIELAAKAGYDPEAMITALSRLSKSIEVYTGRVEEISYFNDHPYTPQRLDNINYKLDKLPRGKRELIAENFLLEFDSVLFGYSPNQGVINGDNFLHPDLDFFVSFPEKWDIDNQASNVGAYSPDRNGGVFVTLDNPKLSPQEASDNFYENLESKYKSKKTGAEPYSIDKNQGYLLSFEDGKGSESMYAYVLWFKMDNKLFKVLGIAPSEYKTELEETARSIRPLTEEDRSSITIKRLRVYEAQKGENLNSLSERVGNVLPTDLTEVINDKNAKDKLKEGELIKVVIEYPYFSI